MDTKPQKLSLKDRKKAQPKAVIYFSEAEKTTIRQTVGKNLDDSQYKIFLYTCQALGLNPLLNEIACVTYKDRDGGSTMSIQVMRDGFLTIAHRSGKFAGLESGVKEVQMPSGTLRQIGWAKVYHKDYAIPVYQEADFEEYSTGRNLWATKPRTMIKKVAEAMALRKAFNVSGVYASEEMDKELSSPAPKAFTVPDGDAPCTQAQIKTILALKPEWKNDDFVDYTKQRASDVIAMLISEKNKPIADEDYKSE